MKKGFKILIFVLGFLAISFVYGLVRQAGWQGVFVSICVNICVLGAISLLYMVCFKN